MDDDVAFAIQLIYLIFIVIWVFIVIIVKLYTIKGVAPFLLFLPLIVFFSGIQAGPYVKEEDEEGVFEASFLAIGLLVLVPLLNWMRDGYGGDCRQFIQMILVGISLTLLSVLDVWTCRKYMRLNRHIRLCFETMAVTIFLIVINEYALNANYSRICKK